MYRNALFALSAATLLMSAGAASAAPCRDAKGHFTKCPTAKPAAPQRCRDAKGHFAKCK